MPPTDRILEARKTYAELAAASQSLRESAAALESAIASLRREVSGVRDEVSQLHDELDRLLAAVAERGRVLRWSRVKMIVLVAPCGFLGALLFHALAGAWQWLLSE